MLDELKRLFKHTTIYGFGNMLGKMVGFFMIPFYTHYLSTADYGTLELLDLTVTLIGLVLTMWMNAAILRHYYDYEEGRERNQVISTILLTAGATGILVATLGIRCSRTLSALILKTPDLHAYVSLIALSFLVNCLNIVSTSYLRAMQRSTLVVAADLTNLVLTLSLNIYFIAILKIGVVGVLYSSLVSGTVIALLLTINTVREVSLAFSFPKLKAMLAFGSPLILTSIAAFTVNFSDRFFLRHYSTVSTVGIYALGYKFGFMLSFLVVQPFDMIWQARMYEIAKQEHANDTFARLFGYYALVLTTVALGLSLIVREVISVIATPDYFTAYKVVPIVALAYIFQGLNRYFLSGAYIAKRTLHLGLIGGLTAVLNFGLNYLLISRYGMLGAAWATTFSFMAMAGFAYWVSQRAHPIPYSLSRFVIPLILAAAFYLVSTLVPMTHLVAALAMKIGLFLLFPMALYLSGFFERREIDKAKELAHTLLSRYGLRAAAASGR